MAPLEARALNRTSGDRPSAYGSASSIQLSPSLKFPRTSQNSRNELACRSVSSGSCASDQASAARMLSCSGWMRSSQAVMSSPASVRSAKVSASSVSQTACRRRTSSAPDSSSRSTAKWRTVSSIMKRPSRRRSRLLSTSAAEALECHVADSLGRLQRAAADEDAQPHERLALGRAEQIEAPADRGGERLLACRRVARAARQEVRLTLEPLQDLSRCEQLRACGGQLDRER